MSSVEDDKELESMMTDLGTVVDTTVSKGNTLDLATLGMQQLEDLKNFRNERASMITKRNALKKAIKIMDKRIEIAVAAIKVLQTPV